MLHHVSTGFVSEEWCARVPDSQFTQQMTWAKKDSFPQCAHQICLFVETAKTLQLIACFDAHKMKPKWVDTVIPKKLWHIVFKERLCPVFRLWGGRLFIVERHATLRTALLSNKRNDEMRKARLQSSQSSFQRNTVESQNRRLFTIPSQYISYRAKNTAIDEKQRKDFACTMFRNLRW